MTSIWKALGIGGKRDCEHIHGASGMLKQAVAKAARAKLLAYCDETERMSSLTHTQAQTNCKSAVRKFEKEN